MYHALNISRSSEEMPLLSIEYSNFFQMIDQLKNEFLGSKVIISDLTLGSIIGNNIRYDFAKQAFDKEIREVENPLLNIPYDMDFASQIGDLIDSECQGNKSYINDVNFVKEIINEQGNKTIIMLILAPLKDYIWGKENIIFIKIINNIFRKYQHKIFICYDNSLSHNMELYEKHFDNKHYDQQSSILNYKKSHPILGIAGVLYNNFLQDSEVKKFFFKINETSYVIPPYLRNDLNENMDSIDFLRSNKENFPLYKANLATMMVFSKSSENNIVEFLRAEAYKRFAEGGYEVCEMLLIYAISITQDINLKGSLLIQLQTNLICQMRFFELAEINIESYQESNQLILGYLSQNKGWGNTMIGKNEIAKDLFLTARTLLKDKVPKVNYLYLLNISARSHSMLGDFEGAFAMEHQIEEIINKSSNKDWHICYINYLNLARLYKFKKNYEEAKQYYIKAFETTLGVRSESDLIFTEITFAELYESFNQNEYALIHIIRSAINFLCMEVPESVAPRVANAVLRREFFNKEYTIEKIAESFIDRLAGYGLTASKDCNFNYIKMPDKLQDKFFISPESINAHLLPGIGFYYSEMVTNEFYNGKHYKKLKAIIAEFILRGLGFADLSGIEGTFIFDTNQGIGIPSNINELVCSATLRRITNIGNSILKSEFDELKKNNKLIINPSVKNLYRDSFGKIVVQYKRYLKPSYIDYYEYKLLLEVTETKGFNKIDNSIINLIDKRILFLANL